MEILTGAQMRSVDRRAIEGRGIPGLLLMEAAGLGVAEALEVGGGVVGGAVDAAVVPAESQSAVRSDPEPTAEEVADPTMRVSLMEELDGMRRLLSH